MNETPDECVATALGILQCLRMLADEAATLNLARTLIALHDALEICEAERATLKEACAATRLPGALLH